MADQTPTETPKKNPKRIISWYDAIFYYFDEATKRIGSLWDDFVFYFSRLLGPVVGKAFLSITGVFAYTLRRDEKTDVLSRIAKISVGLLLAIPIFLIIMFFALIAGAVATITGLRNIGEYKLKEELIAWLPIILVFVCLPFFLKPYYIDKLSFICCYFVLLIGLDFLFGQCGIFTLGHAGFAFLGTYLTAFLYNGTFGWHFPFLIAIPLAGLMVAALGLLLGLPSLRVKDHYLLVITLAFSLTISQVFKSKYLSEYSGMISGGLSVDQPAILSFAENIDQSIRNYLVILLYTVILLIGAHNLIRRSKIGRAFRVIKCDNEVSMILGVSPLKYKLMAFSLSAFYAACAGGLMLLITKFISPSDAFTVFDSINYYVALILGGSGSLFGAALGAIFMAFEVDLNRYLGDLTPHGQYLAQIFYGVLLILTIYIAPTGLAGKISGILKLRFNKTPRRGTQYMFPPPDNIRSESRSSPIKER